VPKLGNLAMRFITVVPLIPLIVLAIEWRLPYGVWGIVFAATVIGIHEYFSMALPEGNYSAGEVHIWDKGEYGTDDEPKKQKRKDQV